ncbi:hypothetical protein [Arthrobacter sp. 35W]|uniref:hypothetical protein n=1 Tax=Arthrobacter sp. 35W TaxID=1132441 RepID=UPI00041B8896|nr:hypothetical protein [Arthrobacter sp. 35W]
MVSRHAGNNWVPLLGLSLLFLLGAAVDLVTNPTYGAVPQYFVVASLLWGACSALWLWKHPSTWGEEPKKYLYLVAAVLAGVLLGSLLPFLRGCGPWLALAGGLVAYGVFERTRILVTAGAGVAVAGLLSAVVAAPVWGGLMHALAAAICAFAANRLHLLRHGRRRTVHEEDIDVLDFLQEDLDDSRAS